MKGTDMKRDRTWKAALLLAGAGALAPPVAAQKNEALKMPVREVTVFKDGHAFVLHAGEMPTNANSNVLLDYLPTPVLGTFWPYSADKKATLVSVTSSSQQTTE